MKILILKDWDTSFGEFCDHWDGIMAAFWSLMRNHQVKFVTKINEFDGRVVPVRVGLLHAYKEPFAHDDERGFAEGADAIVCWGSLDRPWHSVLDEFKHPVKILCHAGGPTDHPNAKNFDVICCESQVYIDRYAAQGKKAIRAFGTNTGIFRYESKSVKTIEALYPASFCFHKNHELFARALGPYGLAVGNPNEETIFGRVQQLGTPVLGRVSSEALCNLYNMSRCVVLPGGPDSGSQRVVLEAFSCGVPVVVMSDNDKCREFVEESGFGIVVEPVVQDIKDGIEELLDKDHHPSVGVDYVKSKWTEHHYAQSILEAISIAKSSRV